MIFFLFFLSLCSCESTMFDIEKKLCIQDYSVINQEGIIVITPMRNETKFEVTISVNGKNI